MLVAEATSFRKIHKDMLVSKWNIICSPDCLCKNPRVENLVMKTIALLSEVQEMDRTCTVTTLKPAEDLLVVLDSIPVGQYSLIRSNAYFYMPMLTLIQLNPGGVFGRRGQDCKMSKAEKIRKLDAASNCISSSYDISFAISPFPDDTKIAKGHVRAIAKFMANL